MKYFIHSVLVCAVLLFSACDSADSEELPNFIIIYTDDMGYGDITTNGNPSIRTPRLDRMAEEGARLTNFYIPANVCTPSRAALLTACYPKRLSLHERVLFPHSEHGINTSEELLPELLKEKGYMTAIFGKWHLGHQEAFLPLQHGFDIYLGIPFSNDMSRTEMIKKGNNNYIYDLPLLSGNDTIELNPDQSLFTSMFTDAAIDFISENRDRPFFVYLPHPMPHIPLYASGEFEGRSPAGLYGDVIEEIDHNTGRILDALEEAGIDENTMVIFASDNGPWLSFKTHGGSAGPFRGGKQSNWEGGHRVPCIIRWPEQISEGTVITEQLTNMDILPTIMNIIEGRLPVNKIDGQDIGSLLTGSGELYEPHPFLYYSIEGVASGIRIGDYKYLKINNEEYLFNINVDFGERFNLLDELPGKAEELRKVMQEMDEEIENEQREAGGRG
ncbi:MAG: sulfatase [Bacteroidales bacterium]|nr:sulfatase [Bacteroidales bacterium]